MSILFVLLMFLLVISVRYFVEPRVQPVVEAEIVVKPQPPVVKREYGFEIPQEYCFHLGHMWATKAGTEDARVGVDKFVTNLMGKIDHIDVRGSDRWVRQGQKLITLHSGDMSLDLLSPVEGVVMAVNNDALRDPSLVTNDPYENGWIAIVKCPNVRRNLSGHSAQEPAAATGDVHKCSRTSISVEPKNAAPEPSARRFLCVATKRSSYCGVSRKACWFPALFNPEQTI